MPDIYNFGLEEVDGIESLLPPGVPFRWLAYEYAYECYEGSGTAWAFDGESLWESDLGHCSCYGPLEQGLSGEKREVGKKVAALDYLLQERTAFESDAEGKMRDLLQESV